MVKLIISGVLLTAACVLAAGTVHAFPCPSKNYYTVIHKCSETKISSDWYSYEVHAYTRKGVHQQFDLNVFSEIPLEEGAFIEASYNEEKGVLAYAEITKKNVPAGALVHLI